MVLKLVCRPISHANIYATNVGILTQICVIAWFTIAYIFSQLFFKQLLKYLCDYGRDNNERMILHYYRRSGRESEQKHMFL